MFKEEKIHCNSTMLCSVFVSVVLFEFSFMAWTSLVFNFSRIPSVAIQKKGFYP